MSDTLKVLAAERGSGKTTKLMQWVQEGHATDGYPGWSRVLVVHNPAQAEMLRKDYRGRLTDVEHRVWSWSGWISARNISPDVEVVIDEIDIVLGYLPGRLVGFSVTGRSWDSVAPSLDEHYPRHPGVNNLMRWLTPNPNLPAPQLALAVEIKALVDNLLPRLPDGPELTEGLRKLLEAKDCFVRASLDAAPRG